MTVSLKKLGNEIFPNIKFLDNYIVQSSCMKYLGFYLDIGLTTKKHFSYTRSKLFPVIKNFMRCRKFLSGRLAALYYKCLIRPILEYCGPVLATSTKKISKGIEAIENRCIKIISPGAKTVTRSIYNIHPITKRLKYLYLLAFNKLTTRLVPCVDEGIIPNYSHTNTRLGASGGFILNKHATTTTATTLGFGASLFNSLPQQIRCILIHNSFKNKLKRFFIRFKYGLGLFLHPLNPLSRPTYLLFVSCTGFIKNE